MNTPSCLHDKVIRQDTAWKCSECQAPFVSPDDIATADMLMLELRNHLQEYEQVILAAHHRIKELEARRTARQ